jgi:hypothetical protein
MDAGCRLVARHDVAATHQVDHKRLGTKEGHRLAGLSIRMHNAGGGKERGIASLPGFGRPMLE